MCQYFHTNCFGGHWNELVVLKGGQLQLLPFVLRRVTRNDKFLPAHVPSHHVAQSQDGAMLRLRALEVTCTKKYFYFNLTTKWDNQRSSGVSRGLRGCLC